MTIQSWIRGVAANEEINFLLTNRIPRQFATRFMGWFSKIENPLIWRSSLWLWRLFTDLDLSEAKKSDFSSLHDVFTRELKEGARPIDIDPAIVVSPCDAIIGASGRLDGVKVHQIKGFPYKLDDLLCDPERVELHKDGVFVTLRLTSSMYHRFHAPHECRLDRVTYVSGDTWNVNPISLRRIENLFCKNERAVLNLTLRSGDYPLTLVPVAAILVASIRLRCLRGPLDLAYRSPNVIPCAASFAKGEEMGWFEHGSTIVVFAPPGFTLCNSVRDGGTIRMGQPLMHLPELPM